MPITAMMVPVTTGGKKRSIRLTSGAISIATTPEPMMDPKMSCAPAAPGVALAMATMGATDAKVTPIITGSLMPNHWVAPSDWISVTRPQQNRSAEISMATCSGLSLSARPTISGTATAPAYITSTCCRPRAASLLVGNRSSTGWVVSVIFVSLYQLSKSFRVRAITLVARRTSSSCTRSSLRLAWDSSTVRGPAP